MLCDIFGYDHDEIVGSNIFSYVAQHNMEILKEQLEKRRKGERSPYEIVWVKSNGKLISTFVSPEPLLDDNGVVEGSFAVITDITELKNAQQSIRNLTQDLIRVQENERQRISRDLHDNVAQELATVKIGCDTLFADHKDIPRELKNKVKGFSRILQNSIMGVRDLAYNLRPPGLDQLGVVTTIGRYCEDFSDKHMIGVDFYSAGVAELKLNSDTEINIYRIIQESLSNVLKHAEATHVTIRLIASYPTIILRVEDDGSGFNVKARLGEALEEKRMGVSSMEERVKLLGGKMKIISRSLLGTKIFIEIPLTKNLLRA
jgi:PAS domain S-box-containing protein